MSELLYGFDAASVDDRKFFDSHPSRKYRLRPLLAAEKIEAKGKVPKEVMLVTLVFCHGRGLRERAVLELRKPPNGWNLPKDASEMEILMAATDERCAALWLEFQAINTLPRKLFLHP